MSEVDQVLCYLQNGKKCLNIFNVNFAWFEKARMHRKQQGYQEERRRSTVGSPWRCSRRSIDCHRHETCYDKYKNDAISNSCF